MDTNGHDQGMKVRDILWLAGLLEGEGCFNLNGSKEGSARIHLCMTDRDVVERAAVLLGTDVKMYKHALNRKQPFQCSIYGAKAAAWMMTLYTLMGSRRKARIREVLAVWKSMRAKNSQRGGRKHPRSLREALSYAPKTA